MSALTYIVDEIAHDQDARIVLAIGLLLVALILVLGLEDKANEKRL